MAPVDDGPQRLLTGIDRARAGREDGEPVVEPLQQLGHVHRPDACRGQFDRQRERVDPRADLGDDRWVELAGVQVGSRKLGPLDEQPHGRIGGEWGQRPDRLTGDTQGLTARCQHHEVRARLEELVHGLGRSVHDVLAVVEHEQMG